jgi:hypothetical protein
MIEEAICHKAKKVDFPELFSPTSGVNGRTIAS